MFILYAVVIGLVGGLLSGGSPSHLAALQLRWGPAIALGLLIQVAIFSTPLGNAMGGLAPWVYVGSNVLVLAAVLRNLAIPGIALVFLGGAANALAILANGGYMPVSPSALLAMGRSEQVGYSNSRLLESVRLEPLTDLFAMPTWIPAANVFSVGDVLIGTGAALAIALAMHGRGPRVTTPSAIAAVPPLSGASGH